MNEYGRAEETKKEMAEKKIEKACQTRIASEQKGIGFTEVG